MAVNVVKTSGLRKLDKERGSQVAPNYNGASLCIHPTFTDSVIQEASRYEVGKLLESDNIGAGRFFVHTPAE
jgi:hypothetical protein